LFGNEKKIYNENDSHIVFIKILYDTWIYKKKSLSLSLSLGIFCMTKLRIRCMCENKGLGICLSRESKINLTDTIYYENEIDCVKIK